MIIRMRAMASRGKETEIQTAPANAVFGKGSRYVHWTAQALKALN
jgi:hypothetical protein